MIPYFRWCRQYPSVKKPRCILKKSLVYLARAAVIAALYFALSVAFNAIAFGPVQFRVSEILVLLPLIFPEAITGLAIGCFSQTSFSRPSACSTWFLARLQRS